jgi:hypothetical protein
MEIFKFVAFSLLSAAVATAALVVIAQPLSSAVRRIVYPNREVTRGYNSPTVR